MERYKNLLIITVFILLLFLVASWAADFITGDRSVPYSTHETGPEGVKAFYLLLEESGHPVQRWNSPLTGLEDDGRESEQIMVIVEPQSRPVAPAEADAVREWVKSGHSLLLLGGREHALDRTFNLNRSYFPGMESEVVSREIKQDNWMPKVQRLLQRVDRLKLNEQRFFHEDSEGISLAGDNERYYLLYQQLGRGEVIAVAHPGIITNEQLPEENNLEFILNAVGAFDEARTVFINEYHHGFGIERPVGDFTPGGQVLDYLAWPFMQFFLVVLLFLLTMGRRFTAPRPLPQPSRRNLQNMVASTSALYREAGAGPLAYRMLYRGFKRRVARKYRMGSNTGPEEMASLGERVTGIDRQTLKEQFRQMEDAYNESRKYPRGKLLTLARMLDRYRKEFNV